MAAKINWRTVEEAVKDLGSVEELLHCATIGVKQKAYRKEQNTRNQILLEMAKKDPRFKQQVLAEQKKRSA